MAGLLPRLAVAADLLGLKVGEALPSGLGQEGRAHEVQTLAGSPLGGLPRAGAPPQAAVHAGGVRLDAQAGAGPGRHATAGVEVRLRHAPDGVEELGGVGVSDVGSARVGAAGVAEGLPAAAGLLRRAAGDADGDALVGEQVEGCDLLSQVERVLVAHV